MAAGIPTNLDPGDTESGHYLDGRLEFQWTAYTGVDALTTQRLRIWDAAGTTLLWDSKEVEPNDHTSWDGGMVVHPEMVPLESLTEYQWDVRRADDLPSVGAYSTKTAFTMGAAEQSGASWRGAQ